jgi:predicted GIY-YIG superfamily endonuclease
MKLNPNKTYVFQLYFLLDGEVIVYIGISCQLRIRLTSHKSEKVFDSHRSFIMPDLKTAEMYEKRWIRKFDPKYNTRHSATPGARFKWGT